MIIIKQTNTTRNWVVGHDSIGWTKYLYLDSTNAQGTGNLFNDTAPTNQVFRNHGHRNSKQISIINAVYL